MPEVDPLPFRTGSVLAMVFTGTLSERFGEPVERIPTPERLCAWLDANGLRVQSCSRAQMKRARSLREAIHEVATAAATGSPLPQGSIDVLNAAAGGGRACPQMSPDGERSWSLGARGRARVEDALAVIAADAITMLATRRERLAVCASPTCRAVFVDASQSHSRRWCDMNTCGNREKKARYRGKGSRTATRRPTTTSSTDPW